MRQKWSKIMSKLPEVAVRHDGEVAEGVDVTHWVVLVEGVALDVGLKPQIGHNIGLSTDSNHQPAPSISMGTK